MAAIYYNSYLLDCEALYDIDSLIIKGLIHTELEGKKFTDKLSGDDELIMEVELVLSNSL